MNGSPYSSWLVASDIDGTLLNKKRQLPLANYKAVLDFVRNGGIFTLASDRNPESMSFHYNKLPIDGVPAIVMGGAGIYDFANEKMLSFKALSDSAIKTAVEIGSRFPTVDTIINTKDRLYISGIGFWAKFYLNADRVSHKYFRYISEVPEDDWGKVVFFGPMWRIKQLKKELLAVEGRDYSVIDSSIVSVQIQAKGANKGTALLKLAEILGVESSHTAAIGDYFNDYKMLSKAEISGCTADSPKPIKRVADYVACNNNDGAVADFLGYLKKRIIENNDK